MWSGVPAEIHPSGTPQLPEAIPRGTWWPERERNRTVQIYTIVGSLQYCLGLHYYWFSFSSAWIPGKPGASAAPSPIEEKSSHPHAT